MRLIDETDYQAAVEALASEIKALLPRVPANLRPPAPECARADVILEHERLSSYAAKLRVLARAAETSGARISRPAAVAHFAGRESVGVTAATPAGPSLAGERPAPAAETINAEGMTLTQQVHAIRAGKTLIHPPRPKTLTDLCREARAATSTNPKA